MKWLISILLFLSSTIVLGQKPAHLVRPSDSLDPDPFVNTVQQSLNLFYADYANSNKYDSIITLFAPLLFSVPIGSFVAAKFYGKQSTTFLFVLIGLALNGLLLTAIAYAIY
jgi:hypothetical protein